MMVRVGKMTFAGWVSLPMRNQFTDTLVFRISAHAGLPPFVYAPLLERMAAHLRQKRPCASLWVQVDAPGDWFVLEVRRALRGLKIPYAVSRREAAVEYAGFSLRPTLLPESLRPAPTVEFRVPVVSHDELRCLQVLGRMERASAGEIASMMGMSAGKVHELCSGLEKRKLLIQTAHEGRVHIHPDGSPSWQLKQKGLDAALRSWGVPKGIQFTSRREEHPAQLGTDHRFRARMWPAWLRFAYPQAEIWTAWSEVRLPETSVIPDGLAWGWMRERETLFWLEVGDQHKSRKRIAEITRIRLQQAHRFCERTGVNLVYAQIGPRWVCEAVRRACTQLPTNMAVVLGDPQRFGELPVVEWGRVNGK